MYCGLVSYKDSARLQIAFYDLGRVFSPISIRLAIWQSSENLESSFSYLSRSILLYITAIRWSFYINCHQKFRIFLRIFVFVKQYFVDSKTALRNIHVEKEITFKHFRLWCDFLDTNSDIGFFFEDDIVVIQPFNLEHLSAFTSIDEYTYIDLAGGFDLNLVSGRLSIDKMEDFVSLEKPVTNTACGYALTKSLAVLFVITIRKNRWILGLPIDWAINAIFLSLNKNIKCYHLTNNIFLHGSMTGNTISWQKF